MTYSLCVCCRSRTKAHQRRFRDVVNWPSHSIETVKQDPLLGVDVPEHCKLITPGNLVLYKQTPGDFKRLQLYNGTCARVVEGVERPLSFSP
jgi:hypothetical protein